MLSKCTCGRYTDFGVTCVNCSISKGLKKNGNSDAMLDYNEHKTDSLDPEDVLVLDDEESQPPQASFQDEEK